MIKAEKYGALANLIPNDKILDLDAGQSNFENHAALEKLVAADISGAAPDKIMAECCISALWLFNNYLDESHSISQEIQSGIGSYLHGIMHRREGDYSNAKYWFNRAGDQPFFESITAHVQNEGLETELSDLVCPYSPVAFVNAVQNGKFTKERLQRLSFIELHAVFDFCFDGCGNH